MKNLKQHINNLQDRVINKDIKVENGIVYIQDNIKYKNQQWWLKVDNIWNALQGGIPVYESAEDIDDDIFEEVDSEELALQVFDKVESEV